MGLLKTLERVIMRLLMGVRLVVYLYLPPWKVLPTRLYVCPLRCDLSEVADFLLLKWIYRQKMFDLQPRFSVLFSWDLIFKELLFEQKNPQFHFLISTCNTGLLNHRKFMRLYWEENGFFETIRKMLFTLRSLLPSTQPLGRNCLFSSWGTFCPTAYHTTSRQQYWKFSKNPF